MKKTITFHVLILMFLAGMFSCEKRNPSEQCVTETSACGTFTACCTALRCYYLYNGVKYECDGTDCTNAANELAYDMCNPSGATGLPCFTEEELLDAMRCISD